MIYQQEHILDEEIMEAGHQIVKYMGFENQPLHSVEDLKYFDFYFQVILKLYPDLKQDLMEVFEEDGNELEVLIKILGQEILKTDLGHLKGNQIQKGVRLAIQDFLQILLLLSKNYYDKEQVKERTKKIQEQSIERRSTQDSLKEIMNQKENQGFQIKLDVNKLSKMEYGNFMQIKDLMDIKTEDYILQSMKQAQKELQGVGRENGRYKDKNDETLVRCKENYKTFLRDMLFLERNKIIQEQDPQKQKLKEQNYQQKIKEISCSGIQLQKDVDNFNKSSYYQQRDQKILMFRNLHRTIFKQEKEKILQKYQQIQEARQFKALQEQIILDSMSNLYKDKIQMLKQELNSKRSENEVISRELIKQQAKMEKELKEEKKKQIKQIQLLWQGELERQIK